jgi:hypothetical protein
MSGVCVCEYDLRQGTAPLVSYFHPVQVSHLVGPSRYPIQYSVLSSHGRPRAPACRGGLAYGKCVTAGGALRLLSCGSSGQWDHTHPFLYHF